MREILQSIVAAFSKALLDVASAKVLAAVGAFATFAAMGQHDEAALVAITFLGVGGAREIVKTVTAGKTEAAAAEATAAVATADPAAAAAATNVAATLTPAAPVAVPPPDTSVPAHPDDAPAEVTRDDLVPDEPDAPEPLAEPEPEEGF